MKRFVWICILVAAATAFSGCEKLALDAAGGYLVKVGEGACTVSDFQRALEIAKLAYAEEDLSNPEILGDIRRRVLRELTEELVLQERARELGLSVSDAELEEEVSKIKEDFPEDSFDLMLLENSISYSYWKEGLRKELLRKRLEAEELETDIPVAPAEIREFHERYLADSPVKPENDEEAAAYSRRIVDQVRKEKAREKYQAWIRSLWDRYDVVIDEKAWNKLSGN